MWIEDFDAVASGSSRYFDADVSFRAGALWRIAPKLDSA
jgi:hypothetical protein